MQYDDQSASVHHPQEEPSVPVRTGRGNIAGSFRAAFKGIARTISTQRNMKLHMISGLMVFLVGMALPLDLPSRMALLFSVALVLFAEILNTALEAFVDLHIGTYHRLAAVAKDAAAAGVLVLAAATVLFFADLLWNIWPTVVKSQDAVWRTVFFGGPLIVLECMGLFWLRRSWLAYLRAASSLALWLYLAQYSEDPIFALLVGMFIGLNAYARHAFPRYSGRGAPS